MPLEKALTETSPKDRNTLIFDRHYGLDGKGGANFQRIGYEVGLTRERVRQIVAEFDGRPHFEPEAVAAVEAVIANIGASLPAAAATIEKRLQAEGVTLKPFRLEGIVNAARLIGRTSPFQVRTLHRKRYVVAAGYPRFADIVTRARHRIRRDGMAPLAACLASRTKSQSGRLELDLVEAILSTQRDFRWLNQRTGWFWFSDTTRNRAVSRIRKMLAVANPLTIGEISAGLARMKCPMPPPSTLAEFCRQIPSLTVSGETVTADPAIEVHEVLNKTEQDIFRLLAAHDGYMSSSELILCARAVGVKRPTFYQCVTYSPIVSRCNQGHYRLIGAAGPEESADSRPSFQDRAAQPDGGIVVPPEHARA
jgi:hypothetical protein